MKQFQASILSQEKISYNYIKLTFTWDEAAGIPRPGQFITIRITRTSVPLLRRPFAFSGYDYIKKSASIIYLIRGAGTEILSGKTSGESLDVIGPLGNYLKIPGKDKKLILTAGGIGLGPMLFYSDELD
jgi:dihydroorotate dehydrogenase electron transfer subunit